jgi:6,7-dimethyl-8-ribityllumazine synthase
MKQKSSPNLDGSKLKIAIILPRFNDHIGEILYKDTAGNLPTIPKLIRVPGALEVPFAAQKIAKKFDVIIALGAIIKGDTAHFDIVCQQSAKGIMDVSLETKTPIINGILTCYTEEQAIERAKEKGKEFAESAIEIALLKE